MSAAASLAGPRSLDDDLIPPLTTLQAMAESARCVFCYEATCVAACPTGIDIPGFIRRIANADLHGAAVKILSENILGGTCARVCPTEVLCEQACVRNTGEERAVAIGRLQRHAVDALMAEGRHPFVRAASSGKRVAVVGAGPAGLACAHRLAQLGHDVTVFEARPKPGGLNEFGIAAYKMAGGFAQAEVGFVLGIGGITIEHGKALGKNLSLADLRRDFAAVFLGVGLTDARPLGIEGEDLRGVRDALPFIEEIRQGKPGRYPSVGRRVVVIGGGNTAIDAAIQASCLGAEEVVMAYRRGPEQMGATEWEQQLAKVSGVQIRPFLSPVRITGNKKGVSAVELERTRLEGDRAVGTGEKVKLAADTVLKAVGQVLRGADLDGLAIEGGKIVIDASYRTNLPGVFAGGDCVKTGQDLTVQAVQDGKLAALAIDASLRQA